MNMNIGDIILGRYQVADLIAVGGQACIAKGIDQNTGDAVSIKQLAATPGQPNYDQELARFKRAAGARICHPNVVDPIDFGEEGGQWYIIMPFIEGVTIDKYVAAQGGKLAVDQAVSITLQVAEGLAAMHQKGYVHRDVKPLNIMVQPDGGIQVFDLGICRNTNERTITQGNGPLGSLPYMSPEQLANPGSEDYRSDLYSLAVLLYLMLTGSPPVQGSNAGSIALSICQWIPPSLRQLDPSVPVYVDQACMRLLAKDRESRFQSAQEFIQAIQGAMSQPAQSNCCPACRNAVQTGSGYCPACGAGQQVATTHPEICIACGTSVGPAPVCSGCNRPFSHCDHRLKFDTGTLTGLTFRIPEGIYPVGRNELSPRDCHISRQHISVACSDGSVHIQDADSTNQTYVSGRPADHPFLLVPGQDLRIAGNSAIYSHN